MKSALKDHFFWKYACIKNGLFDQDTNELYRRSKTVVQYTYLCFLLIVFVHFFAGKAAGAETMLMPLWPVVFLSEVPLNLLYPVFHFGLLVSTLFVILYPEKRSGRVLVFVLYFLYVAILNSFGKINHALHLALMILFCFALMPKTTTKNFREKTLLIFATAQFFLLTAYSLTGFWKVFWGVIEFFTKEVSLFSPLSLRNVLVAQFQHVDPTVLGTFFMKYYFVGWLLYLFIIYVEFFAVFIFFKPNLHRLWGVLLLMLHFGTYVLLGVNKFTAPFAIGMLLLMSPFATSTGFKTTLRAVPVVGEVLSLFKRKE